MPKSLKSDKELKIKYLEMINADYVNRDKIRQEIYYSARKKYGSWENFLTEMKKYYAKELRKESSRRMKLFFAIISMAIQTGREVDVLQCMEAVRRGDADCIRII